MENDQRNSQFTPAADSGEQSINEHQSSSHPIATMPTAGENVPGEHVPGAEIASSMQQLMAEMQSLKEDFDTKVKYDESKERLIDSLHQELQTYREGLHFKILRPLFIDLIAMHDDLGKLIEHLGNEDSTMTASRTLKNLESFQETIEEILRRNGVETFYVEGNTFLPNKQRAIQALETPDPALDKQIARHLRKGFEYEGRILRPELVVTYRAISN
jgi:molecular chaperone GrpE